MSGFVTDLLPCGALALALTQATFPWMRESFAGHVMHSGIDASFAVIWWLVLGDASGLVWGASAAVEAWIAWQQRPPRRRRRVWRFAPGPVIE